MQGANDQTIALGQQVLSANIAEHKVLMFIAQAIQLAQQMGMPIQDENVQAQIATQLVQISAASNPQAQQANVEQQMLQLQAAELQMAGERIQSQDTRESAKLALKNRELDLKETDMLLKAQNQQKQTQIAATGKILDNSAKLADIQAQRLAERANKPLA